ncbi:hypothetical protein [Selenomonas sputigena]|uniref:hypothetical protein n=1 Tax=Selenomonas sputigena TaxID=69823 RepID=UPI002230771E|nr:hypothetical protein [Selenomonas sputigena]UZD42785.1 hypothetical protein OL240_09580 [Selenomonas sputigena]
MEAGLKDEEFRRLVNLGRRSSRVTMIVTVYERPKDRQGSYVARAHILAHGVKAPYASPAIYIARDTLDAVRAAIPADMVKMCRQPTDDPVIVESYM